MASFNVRLYKNTGFDLNNIPDSYSLLQSCSHFDCDAVWIYQDKINGTIRVKGTYGDMLAVDYLTFSIQSSGYSSCYFVTNVTMLNPSTAELSLQLDAVTTIGLNLISSNLAGGWCTRRHVNDDTLFSNNIEEGFIPAEPLEIDYKQMGITNGLGVTVIASTVDLDKIGLVAKSFNDPLNELTVTVPQLPTNSIGTIINITPSINSKEYSKEIPNTTLYIYNRNPEYYSAALALIWSLGMVDSISAIYRCPGFSNEQYKPSIDEDVYKNVLPNSTSTNLNSGGLIWGTVDFSPVSTDSGIPQKWSSLAKNNKVFSDQFNNITVMSFSSGDSLDFNASDIKTNDNNFQFYYWYDPAPNGKSYIRPKNFQGLTGTNNDIFFQIISGSIWPNNQVLFLNREGWNITKKLRGLELQQQGYDSFFNLLSAIGNVAKMPLNTSVTNLKQTPMYSGLDFSNPDNPVATYETLNYSFPKTSLGVVNNAQHGLSMGLKHRDSAINYAVNTGITSPTIKFPIDNSLIELIGNGFNILRTRLSVNDTNRFDRYLTEFGYAVNEPITSDVFSGRQYFNYVKCSDLSIAPITNIPSYIIDEAINHLESGVRIWHTLVNKAAYNNNPIV